MGDFMVNIGLPLTYVLLGIAVVAALGFPILSLAKNPKGAKNSLIGVGLLAVVLGVSYALGSDFNPSNIEITPEGARQVDTGLFAFYILSAIAVGATLYSEVSKMLK